MQDQQNDAAAPSAAETPAEATTPPTTAETPETTPAAQPAADTAAKGVEGAETAAETAEKATEVTTTPELVSDVVGAGQEGTQGAGEMLTKAAEAAEITPPNPGFLFLMGLGLLGLFVWYFVSEAPKRRRVVGSILAIVVAALCGFFYQTYDIERGIELEGGVSMEIKIDEVGERTVTAETQQQVIEILEKRLNALGTGEVILAPSGKNGVFLQVPGVGPEKVKEMEEAIQKVAKLEFAIVHPQSSFLAGPVYRDEHVEIGYKALPYRLTQEEKEQKKALEEEGKEFQPTRFELVKSKADMTGKNVRSSKYYFGQDGHSIQVDFTTQGASIMGPLTRENVNRQLAIIMDGEVVSAPNIREPFSMGCSITGDFTQEEAKTLVAALENPLENPINIVHSNYISPTMGELTIKTGITAGLAGLGITLIFILLYYRFAGIVALIGLLLNIAIIFGALALFRFTLTLPGIAGIILTIGVAIDANVLIYERLREELKSGKSLKAAIDTAYDKALSAIVDANITTLITAVVLYFLATGTVKGFAITLIIGIIASLFSALIVTRLCFGWATESFLKKISFMNIIPDNVIDFLGKRRGCMYLSIALVLVSLIIVPVRDPRGVELKGGDSITIAAAEGSGGLKKENIEESLADVDFGAKPIIQEQNPVGGEGTFFLVRVPDNMAGKVQDEIYKDLGIDPKNTETNSVGSQVGKSMLISSAIALAIGLLIIMLYVTFRFEFAFALGAIVALLHDIIITAGITTLLGQEMSLISVGALLTIAGYSINDTIVVFDRVREGLATKRGSVKDIMNFCLNATLARTILTSATTLIIVVVLFLFGGPAMRNFALTLIVGVLIGTYSSIFVASPIVLWWARKSGTNLRREVLDTEQAKIDPLATT